MMALETHLNRITIPEGTPWFTNVARAARAYKANAASGTQSIVAAFRDGFDRREPMVLRAATAFTPDLRGGAKD